MEREPEIDTETMRHCLVILLNAGFSFMNEVYDRWNPASRDSGGRVLINNPDEVLDWLADPEIGEMGLTAEQGRRYREDPDQFLADYHEVDVAQWRRWKAFHESGYQCTGTTKKGLRCRGTVYDIDSPKMFVPGISDRCHLHVDGSST